MASAKNKGKIKSWRVCGASEWMFQVTHDCITTIFSRTGLSFASVGTVAALEQGFSKLKVMVFSALPVAGAICCMHF